VSTDTARTAPAQPQQISLPNSLMRAITGMAADRQAPPVTILEAAVLITFGYALYVRQDAIDPSQVAIPTPQWNTICQALLDVPTWSGLERVNLGLDWVNLGPATHRKAAGPDPTPLRQSAEMPDYPVAGWQRAVAAGTTRLGYTAWATRMRHLRQATDGRGEAGTDG